MIRYGKNVAKIILRRGTPVWHFVVHQVPTYPEEIYKHFEEVGITDYSVMIKRDDDSLELTSEKKSFEEYPRLIFAVRKSGEETFKRE